MKPGEFVNCSGQNGITCAVLLDKARVQFVGASHGPVWVAIDLVRAGWLS